jgi:hypothetical protein
MTTKTTKTAKTAPDASRSSRRPTSELLAAATIAFNKGEPTRLHVDRAALACGASHGERSRLMLKLMGVYEAMSTAGGGPAAELAVEVARAESAAAMRIAEHAEDELRWALQRRNAIDDEFVAIVDEWLAVVADRTKARR